MSDRALALYGTDEPVAPWRTLSAGPLTAALDGASLRAIRHDGTEVVRAIAFLVRDENWGTLPTACATPEIVEDERGFCVTLRATCTAASGALHWEGRITARADDGALAFTVAAQASDELLTNRAGFVVLHPITGVAGAPVRVTATDGRTAEATFPLLVDPVQPFSDVRTLTHTVRDGLLASVTMTADPDEAWEMEDQRNWTDASFKTYVRPLAKLRPFRLAVGERFTQTVALVFRQAAPPAGSNAAARSDDDDDATPRCDERMGLPPASPLPVPSGGEPSPSAPAPSRAPRAAPTLGSRAPFVSDPSFAGARDAPVRVVDEEAEGAVPRIGLFIEDADPETEEPVAAEVRRNGFPILACRLMPSTLAAPASLATACQRFASLSVRTGSAIRLDLALACREPVRAELDRAAAAARRAGLSPVAVLATRAADLKTVMPGAHDDGVPAQVEVVRAARRSFPDAAVIGGQVSYFTEFNRQRPPAAEVDGIAFATSAIVHDADDASVMQTLEALPSVIASARAIAPSLPLALGPATIALPHNPYGASPAANPRCARVPMARVDPRQRALFGAAWALGYAAAAARSGVAQLILGAPCGDYALWDEDGTPFPLGRVATALAQADGAPLGGLASSDPTRLAVLSWRGGTDAGVMLANLTPTQLSADIASLAPQALRLEVLDARAVATGHGWREDAVRQELHLDAHALARFTLAPSPLA